MAGAVAAEGLERREDPVACLACVHAVPPGGGGLRAPANLLGRMVFMLKIEMIVSFVVVVVKKMAAGEEDQASGGVLLLRGGAVRRREAGTKAVVVVVDDGERNR